VATDVRIYKASWGRLEGKVRELSQLKSVRDCLRFAVRVAIMAATVRFGRWLRGT
jgi:hypothetical protein